MSTCLVSAADYAQHFTKKAPAKDPITTGLLWNGVERRVFLADRRAGHDRRWDASIGRRRRLADRRRGSR